MTNVLRQLITTALLAMLILPNSSGISVELQVPDSPVQEGDIVAIQCIVRDKSGYHVSVTRLDESTSNNQFLVIHDDPISLLPENFELETNIEDDAYTVTLRIVNVIREDAQRYICTAESADDDDSTLSDSGRLVVNYVPDIMYPSCEMDGNNMELMRQAGEEVILDCTTEIGNPPVDLKWTHMSQTGDEVLSSIESTGDGFLTARVVVTLKRQDDLATFTCSFAKTSTRTCSIGPFQVSGSIKELSGSSFNSGMVLSIAILAVVVIIVTVVVVIAALIKCGRCSCDNRNNRETRSDDVDSGQIEMAVRSKRAKKRTNKKQDNNLDYEVSNPVSIPDDIVDDGYKHSNASDADFSKDSANSNVYSSPPEKLYPPPPSYPPEEQNTLIPLDTEELDKMDGPTATSPQDPSIPSGDSPVTSTEEGRPDESQSTDFVATVAIE